MSTYADLCKTHNLAENINTIEYEHVEDPIHTRYIRKITPPQKIGSYDTWERIYFANLLDMRNIFVNGLSDINNNQILYLRSPKFLYKFSKLIYNGSSGYIPPDLEPLNSTIENIYFEYLQNRK